MCLSEWLVGVGGPRTEISMRDARRGRDSAERERESTKEMARKCKIIYNITWLEA